MAVRLQELGYTKYCELQTQHIILFRTSCRAFGKVTMWHMKCTYYVACILLCVGTVLETILDEHVASNWHRRGRIERKSVSFVENRKFHNFFFFSLLYIEHKNRIFQQQKEKFFFILSRETDVFSISVIFRKIYGTIFHDLCFVEL